MRNFKTVPVPAKMRELKTDKRGYPIPFIIMHDKEGRPHFKINDERKVMTAIVERRCAICGQHLHEDMWLVGGPQSAFHPHGAYLDTPIHYECGEYALKVCPYLAFINYHSKDWSVDAEKFPDTAIFIDPTVDPNRVPFFVFIKITNFNLIMPQRLIKPLRPYLEIQYWNNGEQITESFAKELFIKNQKQNEK